VTRATPLRGGGRSSSLFCLGSRLAISGARYDALFEVLKERHPELVTPESPTQRVGARLLRSAGLRAIEFRSES
jgi:hypothetical protein